MTTGVFGGSFNPVHNGHIALARAAVASGLVDRVLMVMSPQNPLKRGAADIAADTDRMQMLREACAPYPELMPCDVEMSMPRPNYTVDTMKRLQELYPGERFRLIIGADNAACFSRWRDAEKLRREFVPIVYPRPGYPMPDAGNGFTPLEAPLMPVSSTQVRSMIAEGRPVAGLLPDAVARYIAARGMYGSKQVTNK